MSVHWGRAAWDGCQPPVPCSCGLSSGSLGNSYVRSVQTTVMLGRNPLVSLILLLWFSCIHNEILCCFSLLWMVYFSSRANVQSLKGCSRLQPENGSPTAGSQEWMEWMLLIHSSTRFHHPSFCPPWMPRKFNTLPFYVVDRNTQRMGWWGKVGDSISGCHSSFWREHLKRFQLLRAAGLHLVYTIGPKSIWEIRV